jgi:hypothetical protein
MPVVGFSELHKHASERRYMLAITHAHTLSVARGVIESAIELDAPIVLSVNGREINTMLLLSIEALARQATCPVGLVANQLESAEQATQAIRSGCSGLILADKLTDSVRNEIRTLASSCGIDVIDHQELTGTLSLIDDELQAVTLTAIKAIPNSWQQFDEIISQASAEHLRSILNESAASGMGHAVLSTTAPWHPVEHLIIYNTTKDEAESEKLAAEGRRVLDQIPGVRATWSGRSIKPDANYRWCWLIRFAHPAVIDSYREHPEHVAYADNHFRPAAGDRVSIDYELFGPEETA